MSGILTAIVCILGASGNSYNGTLTAGSSSGLNGYETGSFGSVSPTHIGTQTFNALYWSTTPTTTFAVGGFSADPGQSWLIKLTIAGTSLTGAGAATYNYSGGVATWTWNTSLGITAPNSYPLTIAV